MFLNDEVEEEWRWKEEIVWFEKFKCDIENLIKEEFL